MRNRALIVALPLPKFSKHRDLVASKRKIQRLIPYTVLGTEWTAAIETVIALVPACPPYPLTSVGIAESSPNHCLPSCLSCLPKRPTSILLYKLYGDRCD